MALGAITYKSAFPFLKINFYIIKVGIPELALQIFSFILKKYIGYIITTLYLKKVLSYYEQSLLFYKFLTPNPHIL